MVSYGQCGTWILPKDHQLFDKVRWVSGPEAGKCQGADDTLVLLLLFVLKSCPTLCYPMDCSTPGFPAGVQPRLIQGVQSGDGVGEDQDMIASLDIN